MEIIPDYSSSPNENIWGLLKQDFCRPNALPNQQCQCTELISLAFTLHANCPVSWSSILNVGQCTHKPRQAHYISQTLQPSLIWI